MNKKKTNLLGGLPGHERKSGGFNTGYSVYSKDGVCPTLLANGGGYGILIVVDKDIAETRNKKQETRKC